MWRTAGASAGAAACQSTKRRLPVWAPSSSMPASRHASPAWVITAYTQAARRVSRSLRPSRTRIHEATDMISQAIRNVMALAASGTTPSAPTKAR